MRTLRRSRNRLWNSLRIWIRNIAFLRFHASGCFWLPGALSRCPTRKLLCRPCCQWALLLLLLLLLLFVLTSLFSGYYFSWGHLPQRTPKEPLWLLKKDYNKQPAFAFPQSGKSELSPCFIGQSCLLVIELSYIVTLNSRKSARYRSPCRKKRPSTWCRRLFLADFRRRSFPVCGYSLKTLVPSCR